MNDREQLRQAGAELRDTLALPDYLHGDAVAGLASLYDELVLGAISTRPGLARRERLIVILTALAALERHAPLVAYARASLGQGLDTAAVGEVVLQVGLYIGFPAAEIALSALGKPFQPPPTDDHPTADQTTLDELDARGQSLMRSLHGARSDAGYASPDSEATRDLYELAIRYGYGVLWHRPGLEVRERLIVAVVTFATLEQGGQLTKFAGAARDAGLSATELREVLMQMAPYAGFPRALNALATIEQEGLA